MFSQNLAHLFFLLVSIFHLVIAGNVLAWPGQIVSVTDGDTIKVLHDGQQVKVRLYGIDAPEKKQAFGQAAKSQLQALVTGKQIDIEPVDIDRYGRTVGIVKADGTVINGEMVKSGCAWVYEQYCRRAACRDWKAEQGQAAKARQGLWQDLAPIPPWEWRKKR